jgi:hypothetical protein
VARLNWEKVRRERLVREHGSEPVNDEFREHEAQLARKRKLAKRKAKNSKERKNAGDTKAKAPAAAKRPLLPVGEVLVRMEKQQRRLREEAKKKNAARERQRQMREAAKRKKAAKRKNVDR